MTDTSKTLMEIQTILRRDGFYHGAIDGIFGKLSMDAIEAAKNPVKSVHNFMTARDEQRLVGVDSEFAAVVRRAFVILQGGICVVEGLRTKARQMQLYAQGRTTAGKVVTWTLNSKHIDGLAVDLAPINKDGSIDWNNLVKFDRINQAMQQAAKELGVKIRWGADWNQNGKHREKGESDSPHWEKANN